MFSLPITGDPYFSPQHYVHLNNLDDIAKVSPIAEAAVDILRSHMNFDTVHDTHHIVRVVRNALYFAANENVVVDIDVIIAGAVLHDLVNLPKNSPDRSKASTMSADLSLRLLGDKGLVIRGSDVYNKIYNTIAAHSWSANISTTCVEANCVQDADRIESLGYLGIARVFAAGGAMGRVLFHPTDPMAENREPDEVAYTLDHYFVKLEKIPDQMKTKEGKRKALILKHKMYGFIRELEHELQ